MVACSGCRGRFAELDGPTHPYMLSSPGCWAAYGKVLAREYADYTGLSDVHHLTVDAFAAQHPHSRCAQNTRSVGIHLCRLCLLLERGFDAGRANAAMVAIAAHKARFVPLSVPANLGKVTVAEVHAAVSIEQHRKAVRRWAASVWEAWSPCHQVVRGWVDEIFPDAEQPDAEQPDAAADRGCMSAFRNS